MSFVTGLLLIDAPASALNNLGNIPGERTDNKTGVKVIRAKDGAYPYVSAQAFRYWLRITLENAGIGWKSAPIYREEKIAYTDANPIEYWDDDLFGYMRAPSKKESAKAAREADASRENETPTTDTITRVAPFRVSTLVSIAPVSIIEDFGVMARHEGNPVPHEHQLYRTTLKGLFSLNLRSSGTFSYRQKTGYRNLDDERIEQAKAKKLESVEKEKAYRLSKSERIQRISTLFDGMALLEGGAKQTLHYTDVAPALVILAVTKGGNHIFGHVLGANSKGLPEIKQDAFEEALTVFKDEIHSPVYVGWVKGYLDEERAKFETFAKGKNIQISHPREVYKALIEILKKNEAWLD
jgi:CRISPR-associated protein Cst2